MKLKNVENDYKTVFLFYMGHMEQLPKSRTYLKNMFCWA